MLVQLDRTVEVGDGVLRPRAPLLAGGVAFALLLTVCIGVWQLLSEDYYQRTIGQRNRCELTMRRICLAMHRYHEQHGRLPPAFLPDEKGRPAHSWRVLLLPYLGYQDLYAKYDFKEPWNGLNNRLLTMEMPLEYGCPSGNEWSRDAHRWNSPTTSYVVVMGRGTAFGVEGGRLERIGKDTILIVECVGLSINWMEPRDLDIDEMAFTVNEAGADGIASKHFGDGANIVFSNCRAKFISAATSRNQVRDMLMIDEGQ